MRDAAHYPIELDRRDVARRAQRVQPAMGLVAEPGPEFVPLPVGDLRPAPARGPVLIVEWILAGAPAIHQRKPVPDVIDVCGNRGAAWNGGGRVARRQLVE